MTTPITEVPAAPSSAALEHFEAMLTFETDCWDTNEALKSPNPDFILVDVRAPSMFEQGHIAGGDQHPARQNDCPANGRIP